MKTKCYCGFTTYCDCGPEPNKPLKSAKKKYNKALSKTRSVGPTISDDFQIGPDGAYEYWEDGYESWDEIYEDYVGEADLHEFVQWLKDNFQVPNKL